MPTIFIHEPTMTLNGLLQEYFKPLASYKTPHAVTVGISEPLWLYREKRLQSIDFWQRLQQLLATPPQIPPSHDDDNNVHHFTLPPDQLLATFIFQGHLLSSKNSPQNFSFSHLPFDTADKTHAYFKQLIQLALTSEESDYTRYATSIIVTLLLRDGNEHFMSNRRLGLQLLFAGEISEPTIQFNQSNSHPLEFSGTIRYKQSTDDNLTRPYVNLSTCHFYLKSTLHHEMGSLSLAQQDLSSSHFICLKHTSIDLTRCNLTGARLQKCIFPDAQMQNVHFYTGSIETCEFSGADFSNATLRKVKFINSTLGNKAKTKTNFSGCDLRESTFDSDCNLKHCKVDIYTQLLGVQLPDKVDESFQIHQAPPAAPQATTKSTFDYRRAQLFAIERERADVLPLYWNNTAAALTISNNLYAITENALLAHIKMMVSATSDSLSYQSMRYEPARMLKAYNNKKLIETITNEFSNRLEHIGLVGISEVVNVELNQNPTLWQAYQQQKQRIKQTLVGHNPMLGMYWHSQDFSPVLDASCGETWLYHGTNPDYLNLILQGGFKSGKGEAPALLEAPGDKILFEARGHGALGQGMYFADALGKAITYTYCPACKLAVCTCKDDAPKERKVLLCRVLLGNVKIARDSENKKSNHSDVDYHSIYAPVKTAVANSRFDCNEFLVTRQATDDPNTYHYPTVYPEFVLTLRYYPKRTPHEVVNTLQSQTKTKVPSFYDFEQNYKTHANAIKTLGLTEANLSGVGELLETYYRLLRHQSPSLEKQLSLLALLQATCRQASDIYRSIPELATLLGNLANNITTEVNRISPEADAQPAPPEATKMNKHYEVLAYECLCRALEAHRKAETLNAKTWASEASSIYAKIVDKQQQPEFILENALVDILIGSRETAARNILELPQLSLNLSIERGLWWYAINLSPDLTLELVTQVLAYAHDLTSITPFYSEIFKTTLKRLQKFNPAEWWRLFANLPVEKRFDVGLILHAHTAGEHRKHIESEVSLHIIEHYFQQSRKINNNIHRYDYIEMLKRHQEKYPFLVAITYECSRMLDPVGDSYQLKQKDEQFYSGLAQLHVITDDNDDDALNHPDFTVEVRYFNQTHKERKLFLSPEVINQIIQTEGAERGHVKKSYTNKEGKANHNVSKITLQGIALFIKERPNHAMMDYAASRLRNRLAGHGSPPSTLARITVIDKKNLVKTLSYPVLLSLSAGDVSFTHLAEDEQNLAAQLEPEHLLRSAIADTLVMPGDLELRNSIVSNIPGSNKLKIEVIDNEQGLVEPIIRTGLFNTKELLVKNWIWCLSTLNELPITPSIRREWLNFQMPHLLRTWLTECQAQADDYLKLFTEDEQLALDKEKKDWPVKFNLLMRPGLITQLMIDLTRTQGYLQQCDSNVQATTFMALLQKMQLRVHQWYQPISIKKEPNKNTCIPFIAKLQQLNMQAIQSLTASASEKNYLRHVPTSSEIIKNGLHTLKVAWAEFESFYKYADSFLTIQGQPKEGEEVLYDLNYHYQADQGSVSTSAQQNPEPILSLLNQYAYRSLILTHSNTIDDAMLLGILVNSKASLVALNVSHCQKLTVSSLKTIIAQFPNLESLDYSFTAIVNITGNLSKLQSLTVNNCKKLKSINAETPHLRMLNAQNCSILEIINTKSQYLTECRLNGCELINEAALSQLAASYGCLEKMILSKTKVSRQSFREAYPYLATLPLDNVSESFFKKIENALNSLLNNNTKRPHMDAETRQKLYARILQHLGQCDDVYEYVTNRLQNWRRTIWSEAVHFLSKKEVTDYGARDTAKIRALVAPLTAALKDKNSWQLQKSAAKTLGQLAAHLDASQKSALFAQLTAALKEQYSSIRRSAATTLGELAAHLDAGQASAFIAPLTDALKDSSSDVRESATIALGQVVAHLNAGQKSELIAPLTAALKDGNSDVHTSAAIVLGQLAAHLHADQKQVIIALTATTLKNAALKDEDSSVCKLAVTALGQLAAHLDANQKSKVLAQLTAALNDKYPLVGQSAATALGQVAAHVDANQKSTLIAPLMAALKDVGSGIRQSAATVLVQIAAHLDSWQKGELVTWLTEALKDSRFDARRTAATALGQLAAHLDAGQKSALIVPLTAALKDSNSDVYRSAATALGQLAAHLDANQKSKVLAWLTAALKDNDWRVCHSATIALVEVAALLDAEQKSVLTATLTAALKDSRFDARRTAATALGELIDHLDSDQTSILIAQLTAMLKGKDSDICECAAAALGQIALHHTLPEFAIKDLKTTYPQILKVIYTEGYISLIIRETLSPLLISSLDVKSEDNNNSLCILPSTTVGSVNTSSIATATSAGLFSTTSQHMQSVTAVEENDLTGQATHSSSSSSPSSTSSILSAESTVSSTSTALSNRDEDAINRGDRSSLPSL